MSGKVKRTYPLIVLQFCRMNPYNYSFELVTWWQIDSRIKNIEIKTESFKPTTAQIEDIRNAGSSVIINKFNK